MKRIIIPLAALVLLATAAYATSRHTDLVSGIQQAKSSALGTIGFSACCPGHNAKTAEIDPVCKMKMDKSKEPAGGKSTYKGVTYLFCAKACKEAFDKNPEKYLKN